MPERGFDLLCRSWGNLTRWQKFKIWLVVSGNDKRLSAIGVHIAWAMIGFVFLFVIEPPLLVLVAALAVWFSMMAAAHLA